MPGRTVEYFLRLSNHTWDDGPHMNSMIVSIVSPKIPGVERRYTSFSFELRVATKTPILTPIIPLRFIDYRQCIPIIIPEQSPRTLVVKIAGFLIVIPILLVVLPQFTVCKKHGN